jgi:hypothetical protein
MSTHDGLVDDLANSFDPLLNAVFKTPPLGSQLLTRGVPIPDLLVIKKSYNQPNVRIYEVKRQRSDFRDDVKRGKWESYLPFCDRFYFALGPEVGEWRDLLAGTTAGVMVKKGSGWSTVRAAQKNPHRKPWPEQVLFALIFCRLDQRGISRLTRIEAEREILLKNEVREAYKLLNRSIKLRLRDVQKKEEALYLKMRNFEMKIKDQQPL